MRCARARYGEGRGFDSGLSFYVRGGGYCSRVIALSLMVNCMIGPKSWRTPRLIDYGRVHSSTGAVLTVRNFTDFGCMLQVEPLPTDRISFWSEHTFPLYGVLLYTPESGLDEKIHDYVYRNWQYLNTMTGSRCLLVAMEDIDTGPHLGRFQPEDIYNIGDALGVRKSEFPCIVFFSQPNGTNANLIFKLRPVLPDVQAIREETIRRLFREISDIVDEAVDHAAQGNRDVIKELSRGINKKRRVLSRLQSPETPNPGSIKWLRNSEATTRTTLQALDVILKLLDRLS